MAVLSKRLAEWRHRIIIPELKGDVLDIGCGDAVILRQHKNSIDSYTGVELTDKYVEALKKRFPTASFLKKDLDKELLNIDYKFDVILLIAIIEHIWNQKFLFEQIIKLLKPGGKIVITSPTPFGNDIVHLLGAKMGIFAQSAVDDHIVIYNKRRFKNLAREFGLHISTYKRFQLFSNQFVVLEKDVS